MTEAETFCLYCQREYASPLNLDRHVMRKHEGTYRSEYAKENLEKHMAPSKTQPRVQDEEWGEEIGSGSLVTWGEPKTLIGVLESLDLVKGGKYGDKYKATFTLDDGSRASTYPPTMLLSRLEQVALGTRVRIDYDGETTRSKSGQDVKVFVVRAARDMNNAAKQHFDGGRL